MAIPPGTDYHGMLFVPASAGRSGPSLGWVTEGMADARPVAQGLVTGAELMIPLLGIPVGATVGAVAVLGDVDVTGGSVDLSVEVCTSQPQRNSKARVGRLETQTFLGNTVLDAPASPLEAGDLEALALAEQTLNGTLYACVTATVPIGSEVSLLGLAVTLVDPRP